MDRMLYVPGPVPLPETVKQAMLNPMLNRRSPDFSNIIIDIGDQMKGLLKTHTAPILIPSSGTGAMECALQNLVSPGDMVLSVSCGLFGQRFSEIAKRLGASVIEENINWGQGINPDRLLAVIRQNPQVKIVLITHNETSTGVVNPIQRITAGLSDPKPILVVDTVSSLGALPCFPEQWGIDVIVSASQKGLLCPPGIGLIWFSERAWTHAAKNEKSIRSYYFNLMEHKRLLEQPLPTNPYTPPLSLYYALQAALHYIGRYGFDTWFEKKRKYAKTFMDGIYALGLTSFVSDIDYRSPAMSVINIPGEKATEIQKDLRSYGIEIAAGIGPFKEKTIRIAHYHDISMSEILMILSSLFVSCKDNGIDLNSDFLKEFHAIPE